MKKSLKLKLLFTEDAVVYSDLTNYERLLIIRYFRHWWCFPYPPPPVVVKVWLNKAMLYMILINVIKIVTLQSFSCSCKDKSVLEDWRQWPNIKMLFSFIFQHVKFFFCNSFFFVLKEFTKRIVWKIYIEILGISIIIFWNFTKILAISLHQVN